MKQISTIFLAFSLLLFACSGVDYSAGNENNTNQTEDSAVSGDGDSAIQEDAAVTPDSQVQVDASLDPDSEVSQGDAQVQEDDAVVVVDAQVPVPDASPPALCGNGVHDTNEVCDDGNQNNNDGCPDDAANGGTCQMAFCGDGFIWTGHEVCDDGNTVDDVTCYSDCQGYCGDGVLQASKGEVCDDGNNVDDATCYGDCSGWCGDGVIDASKGEECDWGQYGPVYDATYECTEVCTLPYCGDGICTYNTAASGIGVDEVIETASNCSQDCEQDPRAAVQCSTLPQLWCPNIYALDTPYNNGDVMVPGQCCGDGTCIIWQSDWVYVDHMIIFNVQNCNSCGNHCTGTDVCIFGVGCMPNP